MLDTNILVSASIYPSGKVAAALSRAAQRHTLVICTHVIEELESVFERKFPHKIEQLDTFISALAHEICGTPKVNDSTPAMRDEDDRPIIQAAIEANVDAILTGDEDFYTLDIERPMILRPSYIAMI